MASLLDLDRYGSTLLGLPGMDVQPPDDRQVSQADAMVQTWQGVMEAMERQRAISAERGLWNEETGLPTQAGVADAVQQASTNLLLSTSAPGFKAYHGSPHSFDRFDSSKIGTGEGAQAYGHGMYFAEREGVAKSYRDELSAKLNPTESATYLDASKRRAVAQSEMDALHNQMVKDSLKQGAKLDPEWGELGVTPLPHIVEQYKPQWDALTARLSSAHDEMQSIISGPKPKGSMYEVNIKADPEHFLHWDKPLSEQHPKVQEAIAKIKAQLPEEYWFNHDRVPGSMLNSALRAAARDKAIPNPSGNPDVTAAAALREAGIPGIRYRDQGSRAAPQLSDADRQQLQAAIADKQRLIADPRQQRDIAMHQADLDLFQRRLSEADNVSHNAVVFDDAAIEILRKYGLAGLILGGSGAAAAGSQQPQQQ